MFIESVELIYQFLVVVKAQKLLHLLDLLYFSLLPCDLLLHFAHHSLVTCKFRLQISYLRIIRFLLGWFFVIF